MFFGVLYNFLL